MVNPTGTEEHLAVAWAGWRSLNVLILRPGVAGEGTHRSQRQSQHMARAVASITPSPEQPAARPAPPAPASYAGSL